MRRRRHAAATLPTLLPAPAPPAAAASWGAASRKLLDGSGGSAPGPSFTLGDPTISVSATFNEHIVAGRIAVQRPPCVAGFGVCDADFSSLFFRFGMNPFVLHATSSSGPWFVDPTHVPNS